MRVRDGVLLGFAQAMALIPGVSRSGGTITAGLFLGFTRTAAVRYSFLLAIPAVVASGLFQLPDVFAGDGPSPLQMVVATLIAFVLGYASIAWLLRYVARHSVYVFVWYRVALGLAGVRGAEHWLGCPRPDRAARRLGGRAHPDPAPPRRSPRPTAPACWPGARPGVELDDTGRRQADEAGRAAGRGAAGRRSSARRWCAARRPWRRWPPTAGSPR